MPVSQLTDILHFLLTNPSLPDILQILLMLITKDIIFRLQTPFLTNDALDSDRINAFNYWCQWDLLHNMPESSEQSIRVVLEHVNAFDLWLWGVGWDIYTFALADAFVILL